MAMVVGIMYAMHQLNSRDFPHTKGQLAMSMTKCSSCHSSNYFWPTPCYPSGGCHDLSLVAKIHWVCFSCSVSPNMIIHELTDRLLSHQILYVTFFSTQLKHLPAKEVEPLGNTQGVAYRIMNPITRNS